MVEAVNPLMQQLQQESGTFTECGQRCQRAMTSVMDANLLLFQTVIAGDGWGEIAVPLIQSYPQTAIILMGSFMTLVFGVLNLVVAVVVDTFADARQNDVQNLAEEMEDEVEYDRMSLAKLFARIDADGSGQVTLDELIEGARKDPIFQSRLRVMDIDESDLQMLFEMIDVDGSGSIEAAEFIGPLSRWAHDSKTAPRFIKYNLMQSMKIQEDMYDLCEDCFQHLALQIDKVYGEVKGLRSQPVKSMKFDGSSPTLTSPTLNAGIVPKEGESNSPALITFSAPQGSPSVPGGSAALNCKEATKEHVFSVNLSRKVALLTGTASAASGSAAAAQQTELQLDISMERVVAQLECSVQRLECFAQQAEHILNKSTELPPRRERTYTDSAGSNGAKADVFWAHYMDRDMGGKRRTIRSNGPGGGSGLPRDRRTRRERAPGTARLSEGSGFGGVSENAVTKISSFATSSASESEPAVS